MSDGYILSDEAVVKINELISTHKLRYKVNGQRNDDSDYGNSSDIYIALTPDAGIPALDKGTDLGTGSGTSGGVNDDIPGFAECDIYKLLYNTGTPYLEPIPFKTETIHNISTTAIPGKTWIVVVKDKFGTWLATNPSGTSSGGGPLSSPYNGFYALITGGTGPTYTFQQCTVAGGSVGSPITGTATETLTGLTGIPNSSTVVVWIYQDSLSVYRFNAIMFNQTLTWSVNTSGGTCTITPLTTKKIVFSGPNFCGSRS